MVGCRVKIPLEMKDDRDGGREVTRQGTDYRN